MKHFWLGFAVASLLWGASGAALYFVLGAHRNELPPAEVATGARPSEDVDAGRLAVRRGRRGGPARRDEAPGPQDRPFDGREGSSGDVLDEGPRELDFGQQGGEALLSRSQIESGWNRGMPAIRRCLVLVASDDPPTGRLVFGVRVAGNGRVQAVNVSGPRSLSTGEVGDCLRNAVKSMQFPAFDGPSTTFHFPLTID